MGILRGNAGERRAKEQRGGDAQDPTAGFSHCGMPMLNERVSRRRSEAARVLSREVVERVRRGSPEHDATQRQRIAFNGDQSLREGRPDYSPGTLWVLGYRVLLRHVPSLRLDDELELIRLEKWIIAKLEREVGGLLKLRRQVPLLLEDVHRDVRVELYQQIVPPPLDRHPLHRALHSADDRFGR